MSQSPLTPFWIGSSLRSPIARVSGLFTIPTPYKYPSTPTAFFQSLPLLKMSTAHDYTAQSRLLWAPLQPQHSSLDVFRRYVNGKHGLSLGELWSRALWVASLISCASVDYHDLHKYSVESYTFWLDLWEHLRVISSAAPDPVCCTFFYYLCYDIKLWARPESLQMAPSPKYPFGSLVRDSTTLKTSSAGGTTASLSSLPEKMVLLPTTLLGSCSVWWRAWQPR